MALTIGSNIASLQAQRQLSNAGRDLEGVYERLSSGLRINKASDDAAGLAISESLSANARIFTQGVRNLNDGISLLNIADSTLDNLSTIITRLEELAAQASNGSYGVQQRKALDAEAQALSEEFFRISRSAKFNGRNLFDGTVADGVRVQAGIGTDGSIQFSMGSYLGTGTFGTRSAFSVGSHPQALTSGDFNGDGILDLASADYSANVLSVMLGTGSGSFSPRVSYTVGSSPHAIYDSDFNNDGVLDLMSVDLGSNRVSILLGNGNGNGTFTYRSSYVIGVSDPRGAAIGDVTGDGIADIVGADYSADTIRILVGNGDGTFSPAQTYSTGAASDPYAVALADFNRDGILDVVTANSGGGGNSVSVLLGQGNGTFGASVAYSVGTSPFDVAVADFNRDGIADIVSADSGSATVSVLLGQGNGTFATRVSYTVGTTPYAISVGDFNGDGVVDLVSADRGTSTLSVLLGQGDGTFNTRVSYTAGTNPTGVISGDFNGDGVLDLVSSDYTSNTLSILLGQTRDGIAPILPFSLRTIADARQAISLLADKRDILATQRGLIGAHQSRLEVATNVLATSGQNFITAASRIRDADLADETSKLVRLQILQRAGAAVLAQANQQPALVTKLLSQ